MRPCARRVFHETNGVRRGVSRPSAPDPFLPFIRDTLAQYPRLRATRLHEMLRQRGYPGSAVYRRVVTLPGEQAQVDWGTFGTLRIGRGVRMVSGFVMVHLSLLFGNTRLASALRKPIVES